MGAFLLEKFARRVGAGDVRDAGFVPVDGLDAAVEENPAALFEDLIGRRLPHLAGAEAGIEKIADERLGRRRGFLALEGADDSLAQGKSLDALRGPVGADLVAGNAPDLFGVGLEEDLEEPLAEAVGDPLGEGQSRA